MGYDLLRDAFHHQHHAAFARRVVDVAGPGNDFVHAAHADDLSGGTGDFLADPAAFEFADGFAGTEKLTGEIHVEHELPIGKRHVFDPGVLLKSGVVDEDVDG